MISLRSVSPGLIVFVVSSAAFIPVLGAPFLFDDIINIQTNYFLRDFKNAAALFSPEYHRVFRQEGYEPLTSLAFMAAGRLSGWQPPAFHAASWLAHAVNSWLVFRISLLILGEAFPACFAGLVFALHPVQAETVAVASFAGTVFSTFFFLLAFYRILSLKNDDSVIRKMLPGFFYGISLLFKERTFLGILFFAAYPFITGAGAREILRKYAVPFISMAAAWLACAVFRTARLGGAEIGLDYLDPVAVLSRAAAYSEMIMLPLGISPVYTKAGVFHSYAGAVSLFLILASGVFLSRRAETRVPALAGLSFFAAGIAPFLNVLPFKELSEYLSAVFVSNRYLYLPMAGLAVFFAALAGSLGARFFPSGRGAALFKSALAAVLAACAVLSVNQQLLWKDEEKAWVRAAELNPSSPRARYLLGSLFAQKGFPAKALAELSAAGRLPSADRALSSNIETAVANMLRETGDRKGALEHAWKAAALWPQSHDAWNTLGAVFAETGRIKEAESAFEKSAALDPGRYEAVFNLGALYARSGRWEEAASAFEKASRAMPSTAVFNSMAGACSRAGKFSKAVEAYLRSLEADPRQPAVLSELGGLYLRAGMPAPAAICLAESLKLEPANAGTRLLVGALGGGKKDARPGPAPPAADGKRKLKEPR